MRPDSIGKDPLSHNRTKSKTKALRFLLLLNIISLSIRQPLNRARLSSYFDAPSLGSNVALLPKEPTSPSITYTIRRGNNHQQERWSRWVRCGPPGPNSRRAPLSPFLHNRTDFTVEIETRLRVLIFGDSVGVQFGQWLEQSAGIDDEKKRGVIRYSWGTHEGTVLSQPTRGGGVVGFVRITWLLARRNEGRPLPNSHGGGWSRQDVNVLMNETWKGAVSGPNATEADLTGGNSTASTVPVGPYDTIIFRIPVWMRVVSVTNQSLAETVELSYELYGVKALIFATIPLNNNIAAPSVSEANRDDYSDWVACNNIVREFARSYTPPPSGGGVRVVLALDVANMADVLLRTNALDIGLPTDELFAKLSKNAVKGSHKSFIAQVCGERVKPDSPSCRLNHVSLDGTHWCGTTIAGRTSSGIACMLACIHNEDKTGKMRSPFSIQDCAGGCNKKYMSLEEIEYGTHW